jgi:multidrug efflux pump subunit AcrA (membrane-fusion protein)
MFRIEHNVETGEIATIELTANEIAELEKEEAIRVAKEKEMASIESAKASAKEAAQAKLAALGLSTDDLKALGL